MGIKVNLSDQEAKSGGEYEPLPSGRYHVCITDVELKHSKSEKNPGKPMLNFELTIQEGKFADRMMYSNACCWDGALYTIVNILKGINEFENCGGQNNLDIPTAPEFYIGKELFARRGVNPKKKKENPNDDPMSWIEIRGFSPLKEDEGSSNGGSSTSSSKKKDSMLP
jgi:hypothetical protein